MKTISIPTKELKSTPLSLSKAARYLKKFVESDSGASEANLGFLKRASAAFNELNAFHKEIERSKSKSRRNADGDEVVGLIEDGKSGGERSEVIVDDGNERKKKKKKHREVVEDGGAENSKKSDRRVEMGGSNGEAKSEVDGRKRKKSVDGELEGKFEDSEERRKSKKKKKRENKEGDA